MWNLPRLILLRYQNLKLSLSVLQDVEVSEAEIEMNRVGNITEIVIGHNHAHQVATVQQNLTASPAINGHITRKSPEILTIDRTGGKNPKKINRNKLAAVIGLAEREIIGVDTTRIINLYRFMRLWQKLKLTKF